MRAMRRVTGADGREKRVYEYKVNNPDYCF